jgi:hypothetical protein
MKILIISLLVGLNVISAASTVGIPDGDTGLLISIVGNTSEQIVRLEKLLSNSEKQLEYTKKLKETADSLESSYDRLTSIQSTLNALVNVSNTKPEDLRAINDTIEEIQDQRDRLEDLIQQAKVARDTSQVISEDTKANTDKVKEVVKLDQAQIKRANSSSVHNQSQETAKNTAYISSKITESNLLLRKNIETNALTNSLMARNLAKQTRDEEKNLEFMGVIKNEKKRK